MSINFRIESGKAWLLNDDEQVVREMTDDDWMLAGVIPEKHAAVFDSIEATYLCTKCMEANFVTDAGRHECTQCGTTHDVSIRVTHTGFRK